MKKDKQFKGKRMVVFNGADFGLPYIVQPGGTKYYAPSLLIDLIDCLKNARGSKREAVDNWIRDCRDMDGVDVGVDIPMHLSRHDWVRELEKHRNDLAVKIDPKVATLAEQMAKTMHEASVAPLKQYKPCPHDSLKADPSLPECAGCGRTNIVMPVSEESCEHNALALYRPEEKITRLRGEPFVIAFRCQDCRRIVEGTMERVV